MYDPRESRRWGFEATVSEPGLREEIGRFAELNRKAEQLKDRFKVLSLTQDDPAERPLESDIFGRGYAHPRLWEHYGENHRGDCLYFDRETLTRMAVHDLSHRGEVHHGPVSYVDAEIAVEARRFLMEEFTDLQVDDFLRVHVAQYLEELFFTQLKDWETEFAGRGRCRSVVRAAVLRMDIDVRRSSQRSGRGTKRIEGRRRLSREQFQVVHRRDDETDAGLGGVGRQAGVTGR
jgi:hypothetical protein